MNPKRKNPRTIQTKAPTTSISTVFFYHPDEKPFGVFCQGKPSRITIPTDSLEAIVDKAAASAILAEHGTSITFTCAEQVYMFCKALHFCDADSCRHILASPDPAEQKKLGQSVEGFSDDEWDRVKDRVARIGNWYKFTNPDNKHMRSVLLATEDKELAEAGRRDRIWGIGYQAHEAERYRQHWGMNKLGKALMAVRTRIRTVALKEIESGVPDDWLWDGGAGDEVDEAKLKVLRSRQGRAGVEGFD